MTSTSENKLDKLVMKYLFSFLSHQNFGLFMYYGKEGHQE